MSQSVKQTQRQTDKDINPLFLNRWSPRAFSEKNVPEKILLNVLEAARWAPSGSNLQPWRYIVARKPEDRAKFHTFINAGNREWCEKAPVLLALVSHKLTGSGNLNRSHSFDAGASWGYLALEAARQGLIAHAMGGFDVEMARSVLGVPEDYEINVIIAMGYQGDVKNLPEKFHDREKPSDRRPLTSSIFEGGFDQSISKESL
jgi:nitroreductase